MAMYTTHPAAPSQDKRWKLVDATMRRTGKTSRGLIETLHKVQEAFGYIDEEALRYVAMSLRVPLSRAYGVVTFYHFFTLKPPGKHNLRHLPGHGLLHQGRRQADSRGGEAAEREGRTDHAEWRGFPGDGALCRSLRTCSGCAFRWRAFRTDRSTATA